MPQLIKTMQLFNYSPDLEGVCFGISVMAAQAALRKDNKIFADRIRFIQNCTAAEIETIKNSERSNESNFNKKLNLMCFFDGISIYQGASSVNSDFTLIAPVNPNINATIKIIKSEALESDNKFTYPEIKLRLVNAYSREEFLHFIKAIKKFFGQQSFSILITHSPINHATQIGFDQKNWLSTNHDSILLGRDNSEHIEKIVNNVFHPERYGSTERMVAAFDILLPENMHIDLKPLEVHNFSTDELTDSLDKDMLSHILATSLGISRYDAYLEILQKASSLRLTENEKITLIESKHEDNTTALHRVAYYGKAYILHQLLKVIDRLGLSFEKKIGIINKKNNQGLSALCYAAQNGHTEVVKILLDLGASIGDQSLKADFLNTSASALFIAAGRGHTVIVYELIQAILAVKNKVARNKCLLAKMSYGMSALCVAAQNGHVDIVYELIKAISSIENQSAKIEGLNAIDDDGESALFAAAKKGHESVIKTLVAAISSIKDKEARLALLTSINKKGESALSIAEQGKHESIVKLLRAAIKKERRLLSEKNCLNLCAVS